MGKEKEKNKKKYQKNPKTPIQIRQLEAKISENVLNLGILIYPYIVL